ncbi:hypothetical protein T01_14424, partial [Trichinella spiralis]
MRYREESGGQEHSDFSSCFLMLAISRFQSQLTDFPMYRLAEVEVNGRDGLCFFRSSLFQKRLLFHFVCQVLIHRAAFDVIILLHHRCHIK